MKKEKGITLIALTITIVVLLILAGIGFSSGTETIQKAKLEELKTNMLLIKAKAREYVEEANFKIGIGTEEQKAEKLETVRNEIYVESEKLQKADAVPEKFNIADTSSCYWLTNETKNKWGLEKLEMNTEKEYLIQFKDNEDFVTVEVYNIDGYDGQYSLTEIEEMQK